MSENQEENSLVEEDDILEDDDVESEEPDLDTNDLNTSYHKFTVESLTRRPIHQEKESFQKATERQYSNYNKNKETEQRSAQIGTSESSKSYILPLCLVILITLAGLLFYIFVMKPSTPFPNKQLDVQELMRNLKSRFEGQPPLTYRVIEAAMKRASSENSDSPGIIVLISSNEAIETAHELADALVQLVSKPLNSVLIEAGSSLPAKHLKKEIDVTIRGNLTEMQMRAVLVRNLDRIPFEAAMIFHSYCDHENAPFKRVVYVMTASVEEMISPDSDSKQWDVLASKCLRAAWPDSGEDQVASLISRLTVSVAAVVPK